MWNDEDTDKPTSTAIPLKADKALLKRYYSGQRLESPMGGFLELLGSQSQDNGSSRLLFECSTSSLRFELIVPKGSRGDREKVKKQFEAGEELLCPRCDNRKPMLRNGADLACQCGASFGRAF